MQVQNLAIAMSSAFKLVSLSRYFRFFVFALAFIACATRSA